MSIYSRNSENNTGKYPDLAAMLPRLLKDGVTSAVLDAEAVAFDRGTGKILPFQVCPSCFSFQYLAVAVGPGC